jgi:hypothetical protein
MTVPFSLLTGNLNPSCSDLNSLINQLNALFANASAVGDQAVAGNLAVTGTTALTGNATAAGTLTVTGLTTINGGLAGGSSADIAINTNKFTVAASSGNTLVAGTLAVTGASTLTGTLTTAGHTARSVGNDLTAAGTTRTDALALTKDINNVTTAAASTGVTLPAGVVGEEVVVINAGANAIQVYGNGSDTIDTVAGSTGVVLTNGKRAIFMCVAANTIVSAQLGVVSA